MLGNLKEFISVVQDGISSNNNLRQTLQEVQRVTNIFNKDTKLPPEAIPRSDSQVNYGAGGELLAKYQEDWVAIHDNAESNARAAEEVDKLITEIHNNMERRLKSANELAENLAYIPTLTATIAEVIGSLKSVQSLIKTVEEELVHYEDVVER
ncbi:Dysbindin-like protein, partial [Operophtera brumata]